MNSTLCLLTFGVKNDFNPSMDTRAQVLSLYEEHPELSMSEMAELLGVSRQRISQIWKSEGLPPLARGKKKTTGRQARLSEYNIWSTMKDRCKNPNSAGYKWYGARGVRVCQRWQKSFDAFYADMGPRPSPKHSIDRIDNSGNYEPENCHWATAKEQKANSRNPYQTKAEQKELARPTWFDGRFKRDRDAAAAITAVFGRGWSPQSCKREFGPSGRPQGRRPKSLVTDK